ncbi:hypothetical protein DCS_04216 [Drechmeria coniospora]|uniref:Uncharacterized protein n=1 Tax=Drechmeria coniospora TaxID=98403 RepID=A0A151GJE6_DRECN|nr:hypothetical protein DCS_04216 [Drechmeria coniospora]KYK57209.1 hypothetical protein DCS_04216 [Drechmeria coniospora]
MGKVGRRRDITRSADRDEDEAAAWYTVASGTEHAMANFCPWGRWSFGALRHAGYHFEGVGSKRSPARAGSRHRSLVEAVAIARQERRAGFDFGTRNMAISIMTWLAMPQH